MTDSSATLPGLSERVLSDPLLQNIPSGVAILDNDFVLRSFNPACAGFIRKYVSSVPEQALGKCLFDFIPECRPAIESVLRQVRATGKAELRKALEVLFVRDDRHLPTYWDTSATAIREKDGTISGVLLIFDDVTLHQRAAETLRQSEQKYRFLLENTRDLPYAIDSEGIFTFCGPQVAQYGYTPEEVVGRPFMDFVHPDDVASTVGDFRRATESGGGFLTNCRILGKDGGIFHVEETGRVIRRGDQIVGHVGVIRDVTERHQRQQELEEVRRHIELVLGTTRTMLDVIDSEYNLRYLDAASAQALGPYSGQKCYRYFAGRGTACPDCGIPIALRQKTPVVKEHVIPLLGNRPVQITSVPFQNDKGEWLVAEINTDLSAHRQMEATLRESEQRYRSLVENAPVTIARVDRAGKFVFVNRKLLELTGLPAEAMVGAGPEILASFTSTEYFMRMVADVMRAMTDRARSEGEFLFRDHRGTEVWILQVAYPWYDARGEFGGVEILGSDITGRKLAEHALQKKVALEDLILDLSTSLVTALPAELDSRITATLQAFAEFEELDRAYVCLFDEDRQTFSAAYGWYSPSTHSQRKDFQQVPLKAFAWTTARILHGETVEISRVEDYPPEARVERALCEQHHILSLLFVPLIAGHEVKGWIGFDRLREPRRWQPEKVKLVRRVAETVAQALERRKAQDKLNQLNAQLEQRVRERTHELEAAIHDLAHEVDQRKHSEEALRLSHEYFRRTFDQSPIGAAIVSLDYRFLRVNAELCRITGYSAEELIRFGFPHVSDPDDLQANVRQLRRMELGEIEQYQAYKRFIRKDGTFTWTRLSVRMIKDSHGRPLHFLPMMEDVTVQKQTELALCDSEARFRQIFERSRDAVLIGDLNGRVLDCNQAMLDLIGYTSVAQLLGKTSNEFTAPEFIDPSPPPLLQRLQERGYTDEYEKQYLRSSGERIWVCVQVYLRLDHAQRPVGTWAIIRDIQARKQAEADRERLLAAESAARALAQASEQRYRMLTEAIPQMVFITRADGHAEYISQRWFDYTGTSPGRDFAFAWRDLMHPDDLPRVLRTAEEATRLGTTFETELRYRRADGAYRWFLSRALPLRDSTGRVVKWFGTDTDIHERKQAEMAQRLLADASAALAGSLDYQITLNTVARLAVPQFADWCMVDVLDQTGQLRRLAVAHADPTKADLARRWRNWPPDGTAMRGVGGVLRSGKSELTPEVSESLYPAIAGNPQRLALLRELQPTSHLVVALLARGRVIGSLLFVMTDSGRRYSSEDVYLAEELARRAALAIDNARLYAATQSATGTSSI